MNNKNERNLTHSLWDSVTHLLLFISLYILMITLSLTLHIFVDHWFPGSIEADEIKIYLKVINLALLRYYIAGLIISYPVFSLLFLTVTKRTMDYPEVRELISRRVLIYLTLFITFIILISSGIKFLFNFLDGNISLNLLLHFITTVLVNGIVFVYYFQQFKTDRKIYV